MNLKWAMILWVLLGIVIVGAAAVISHFFVFGKANPPLVKNEVRINGAIFEVEIASTTMEKARGLSFRASLGAGEGMLFLFDTPSIQSFWMKDMNFPIDMIWIGAGKNGDGKSGYEVLGFAQNAVPQLGVPLWNLTIYNSPDGTDKVLEVNAGTVAKDNIKVGDAVQIGPLGG